MVRLQYKTALCSLLIACSISYAAASEAAPKIAKKDRPFYKLKMAGLHVAVWQPVEHDKKMPLVIFSHGYGGKNTQSKFITEAMARAGYLVLAPNHKDATMLGISLRPDCTFPRASRWTDSDYANRRRDLVNLITALHQDPYWNDHIDWNRLIMSGHSLGGYTVLGMAGAWPSWKMDGIKAVLGFSPYSEPFAINGKLADLNLPVMYQGGTRDGFITPSIKKSGGVYSQTSSPACFVEFDHMNHLGWTHFNHNRTKQALINYYWLAFLDKYVQSDQGDKLERKLDGVSDLEEK